MLTRAEFDARAARIALLLTDVDGTLTDGGLYYSAAGDQSVRFNVRDGLGFMRAREAGLVVGLVSGRDTPHVRRRGEELRLGEILLGVEDKASALEEVLARRGLPREACCFLGDDINDLGIMARCGLSVAVGDAEAPVREAADWVLERAGGHGALRELVELLLAARDR